MKFIFAASILFSLASAHAGVVQMTVGESARLSSCGGQVTVNNGGRDNQLNVVIKGSQRCSVFRDFAGRTYNIPGNSGSFSGSFTATTADQNRSGNYSARFTIYAPNGGPNDQVEVTFRVRNPVPAPTPVPLPLPTPRNHVTELSKFGTLNGQTLYAYEVGDSMDVFQARMRLICVLAGATAASTYSVAQPSYLQPMAIYSNGWTTLYAQIPERLAVFTSLVCY